MHCMLGIPPFFISRVVDPAPVIAVVMGNAKIFNGVLVLICILAAATGISEHFSCPVEMKILSLEPAGMIDSVGRELSFVTLSISNCSASAMLFSDNTVVQARLAAQWVDTEAVLTLGGLGPRRLGEFHVLIPQDSEAFRLRLTFRYAKRTIPQVLGVGQMEAPNLAALRLQQAVHLASPSLHATIWPTNAPKPVSQFSRPQTILTAEVITPGKADSGTNTSGPTHNLSLPWTSR